MGWQLNFKRDTISDLNPSVAIKTFPGATVNSIKGKLDLSKCNTIILHVGGNDADNGTDIETFYDNYVSLLESLQTDDRRLIVSGLLPRASVDLEPFTNKLKALCAENDLEYIKKTLMAFYWHLMKLPRHTSIRIKPT